MAIRMTPSQARSKMRQLQNKQRQTINKYNRDVRQYNQKAKQAVNKYNREASAYNSRVRQNRQRLRTALTNLQRAPIIATYSVVRQSTLTLNDSYVSLETHTQFDETDPRHRVMLELPQQETANSLAVTAALLGAEPEDVDTAHDFQNTAITSELADISSDLHSRWTGALFALNPQNPDATRHFCASSREIFVKIFEIRAPDESVIGALPGCQTTPQGTPTRRAKILYLLHVRNLENDAFEDFIEQDIGNVIELFEVFNAGTHGPAGRLTFEQLVLLKKRVEDALIFLCSIAG